MYDVIIIGSGPAGLSAAIYGNRAKLDVLVIEKAPFSGGQIVNTYEVDNYPGLHGIGGFDLADKFRSHADAMGMKSVTENVVSVDFSGDVKKVATTEQIYEGRTVLIATGASHRKLNAAGEDEFSGKGVSYCATCDGAFFCEKDVAVVGGGDVALEDALFLARGCGKVYLVHRRDEFRGAKILQEAVEKTANIEICRDTVVEEIKGEEQVSELLIFNKKTEEHRTIAVGGIFIAVGLHPNTELFKGKVGMDEGGYIIAGEDCITDCAGVFAAGDVRTKRLRQVITAAADGANAITSIERML